MGESGKREQCIKKRRSPLTGLEALGEPFDTIREPTPKRELLLIILCQMKISEVSKTRLKAKASIRYMKIREFIMYLFRYMNKITTISFQLSYLTILSFGYLASSHLMAKNQAYIYAFGKNLKALLDAKGISPEDVAAHGNIETKQVYRVINGEHSAGLHLIYSLAKGIGIKPKLLFDFDFKE